MKFDFKKTRFFWLYIVIGVLSALAGIIFAPPWSSVNIFFSDWGAKIVRIMIGVAIFLYVFLFLLKRVKRTQNSAVQMLTVIEIVLFLIIGIGCFLSQFQVISIGGPCHILGVAFWCRGAIETFRGYYYYKNPTQGNAFSIANLVIALLMITFGTYIFAKPFFNELHLQWIFSCTFFVVGALLITYGAKVKPRK